MRGKKLQLFPPVKGGSASPVLRGIEGLWLMDEGAGNTTADSSGNGHTVTLDGAPRMCF